MIITDYDLDDNLEELSKWQLEFLRDIAIEDTLIDTMDNITLNGMPILYTDFD
jgi:hypothetical protein